MASSSTSRRGQASVVSATVGGGSGRGGGTVVQDGNRKTRSVSAPTRAALYAFTAGSAQLAGQLRARAAAGRHEVPQLASRVYRVRCSLVMEDHSAADSPIVPAWQGATCHGSRQSASL